MGFSAMCTGKVAHHSHAAATKHCRLLLKKHHSRLQVYRCPNCRLFHVGGAAPEERPPRVFVDEAVLWAARGGDEWDEL